MNFKNIMLKKNPKPNSKEFMIPIIRNSKIGKSNLWSRKNQNNGYLRAGTGRDSLQSGDGTVCILVEVWFS